MGRTVGAIGWKTKQKYLHDKFPDQGWMDETDKKVINEHYKSVKECSGFDRGGCRNENNEGDLVCN